MSVNKVILVGNVGKDPEVKYFDNGSAVANFTLATTERGYTAQNGTTIPDRTEWHNIICWRGLAKIAEQYVKKGGQLCVEGKIRSRSYDDANGVKRYVYEIYADTIELLGKKPDSDQSHSSPSPSTPNEQSTPTQDDSDLPF